MEVGTRAMSCPGNGKYYDEREKRKSREFQKSRTGPDSLIVQRGEERRNNEAEDNMRQIDGVTAQTIQLYGVQ